MIELVRKDGERELQLQREEVNRGLTAAVTKQRWKTEGRRQRGKAQIEGVSAIATMVSSGEESDEAPRRSSTTTFEDDF